MSCIKHISDFGIIEVIVVKSIKIDEKCNGCILEERNRTTISPQIYSHTKNVVYIVHSDDLGPLEV